MINSMMASTVSESVKNKPVLPKYPPNKVFISIFMFIQVISGLQIGYAMTCLNRMDTFLKIKYDWPKNLVSTYTSLLTASAIIGLAFGGFTSGRLMTKGRKQCMLIATVVGVVGVGIEMIDNMWAIFIGRLIYGYACGLYSPCIGRYIEEVVPMHLVSALFPIYTCGMSAAGVLVMATATVLP